MTDTRHGRTRTISVVIPVYRGVETLPALMEELRALVSPQETPQGRRFRVSEVVLVWDAGPDSSDVSIREAAAKYPHVRPVWLSKNFGQHPATVAGLAASTGEWVVTMDEDGQHDPASIGAMLDAACENKATLVYAKPTNEAPHRAWRNAGSKFAKGTFMRIFVDPGTVPFHSFRLIAGEHARAVSRIIGPGMYLDVALQWVVRGTTLCPVELRKEGRPAANYTARKLFAHFWRLVISVGTRPLRIISGMGFLIAGAGVVLAIVATIMRLTGSIEVDGWTSSIVVQLVSGGFVMVALGVIAEYIGTMIEATLGRPTYVVGSDPGELFSDTDTLH